MERFLKKYSRKIIIGVLAFVGISLVAVGGTWWNYRNSTIYGSDVLATVGSEEITKTDFKHLAYVILRQGTPDNPTLPEDTGDREQILNTAIEKVLVTSEAKTLGLTVTDAEALTSLTTKDPRFTTGVVGASDILEYEKYLLEKDKITEKIGGDKSGSVIIAREDLYYPLDGALTADIENKIAANYTYSEQFINDIYAKLVAGTITSAQAIDQEKTDTTIGENANPLTQTFHSGTFSASDYRLRSGLLVHPEVLAAIDSLKAGEISKPVQIVSAENIVGDHKNLGWVVIALDKNSGESGQTFVDWLINKRNAADTKVVGDLSSIK